MSFSMCKRLSLPDLTPTCMTLELADRSISYLVGVAEDVYVKVPSTPLPKKKQVTAQEPQRTSPIFTQKPPIQHKKPTVLVNIFSQSKPATEARKPISKRHSSNSNPFSSKSVQARRAAEYNMNLYVDISQFVDCSSKSVKTKPHQAKRVVNTSGNSRKNNKEEVARVVPIWKPT
nr:reverse transcriptase domain-containing protein [Tanacetum cinerariifolium]